MLPFHLRAAILLFFLLLFPANLFADAERVTGKIVSVADGDTVTVLTASKHQVKVALGEYRRP